MSKLVYWVGSIDPVYHAGLQRFLKRGDSADASLVSNTDDRWAAKRPADAATGEEQPTAADAAPQEVKDASDS
jgi:hypothetical protein